jgi:hypothetical protein
VDDEDDEDDDRDEGGVVLFMLSDVISARVALDACVLVATVDLPLSNNLQFLPDNEDEADDDADDDEEDVDEIETANVYKFRLIIACRAFFFSFAIRLFVSSMSVSASSSSTSELSLTAFRSSFVNDSMLYLVKPLGLFLATIISKSSTLKFFLGGT